MHSAGGSPTLEHDIYRTSVRIPYCVTDSAALPTALTGRDISISHQYELFGHKKCWAHAEGLARQLRLCGLDAASVDADPGKEPRHRIYRWAVSW